MHTCTHTYMYVHTHADYSRSGDDSGKTYEYLTRAAFELIASDHGNLDEGITLIQAGTTRKNQNNKDFNHFHCLTLSLSLSLSLSPSLPHFLSFFFLYFSLTHMHTDVPSLTQSFSRNLLFSLYPSLFSSTFTSSSTSFSDSYVFISLHFTSSCW